MEEPPVAGRRPGTVEIDREVWQQRMTMAALRALPRNAISRLVGRIASAELPQPLQRWEILAFGRTVGVDFSEALEPPGAYPSLQAFFVRALKPGRRPVDPAADAFVSPCDGAWGEAGTVTAGALLQAKSRPYSVGALLGSDAEAQRFEGGAFATLYLSPKDYHRFHMPCAGRIHRAVYVPGTLWPVNRAGVEGIDGVFAQNERICAHVEVPGGDLCLVAVGATNVGKIRLAFDDMTTNVRAAASETRTYAAPDHTFAKGAEWGRFEFGSTIVILAGPGVLDLDGAEPGTPLVLGTRIGRLTGLGSE